MTNGNYKKKKEKNGAKMESSRVWPITNEMKKRGSLTNDNFMKIIIKIYKSLAKH